MQYRIARNFRPKHHSTVFSEGKSQPRSLTKIVPENPHENISRASPSIDLPAEELEWQSQEKVHSYKSLNKFDDIQKILDPDDGDDIQNTLENGRVSKVEYQKFKIIEASIALLGVIATSLIVFAADLEFQEREPGLLAFLLWISCGLMVLMISLTALRYLQKIKYMKGRTLLSKKDNLFTSGEIYNLVFEVALILLQPYPFFTGIKVDMLNDVENDDYFYCLNDILALLVVVRLYLLIRLFLNNSKYRSPQARRVSVMYGADNDYLYAAKCLMRESPLKNVLCAFFGSIFIFGYMIRICERPLARNAYESPDFRNYLNSMWCVIVTMTTVGYGDVYPRTSLGRLITLGVCLWGVFIVSLMVVSLNNILTLSNVEEKTLTVLKRLDLRKKLEHQAAYVLTNVAKIGLNNRKSGSQEQAKIRNRRNIIQVKRHLHSFRDTSRKMRSINDNGGLVDEMHRRFDIMGDIIHDLATKQEGLEKTLNGINQKLDENLKIKKDSLGSFPVIFTKSDVTTNLTLKTFD